MAVTASSDKREIEQRLVENRKRYLRVLEQIADEDLTRKSGNQAWTVCEVLTHITWSFELLPKEISKARKGKGMYNLPRVIRDPANAFLARRGGRGQSIERLRPRYEAAFAAAMTVLRGLRDDDFSKGAKFWGEGFFDIATLYSAQTDHLDEHLPELSKVIPGFKQ